MTCCNDIKDLGCFDHCEAVLPGITVSDVGTYTLITDEGDTFTKAVTGTTKLSFAVSFNEDRITLFQVIDPNGVVLTNTDGNNCFQATVRQKIVL